MNALQKLQSAAGQKGHEQFYEATLFWNNQQLPCTHGDIVRNPPLIEGGFSPNTEVIISVRDELFGAAEAVRPKKGDLCRLQPDPDKPFVFALQITTIMTSVGDVLQKFLCHDEHQGA